MVDFTNEMIPFLEELNIFSPGQTCYEYETVVMDLIFKLSDRFLLSKTTMRDTLAECTGKEWSTAWGYLQNPQKRKITAIPYFFFTCALERQKSIYEKSKPQRRQYEKLCKPELRQLAEYADKIVAVLAACSDLSPEIAKKRELLLPSMPQEEVQSMNYLLETESDFFRLWDKRELFFQLDDKTMKFFRALIMLSPNALSTLKEEYSVFNIRQMENMLYNTSCKKWIDLLEPANNYYNCDFGRVAKALTTEPIARLSFSLLFYGILLNYRVTKDDLFILGLYDSIMNEKQKEELFKIVSDMGKKDENRRKPRKFECCSEKDVSLDKPQEPFRET